MELTCVWQTYMNFRKGEWWIGYGALDKMCQLYVTNITGVHAVASLHFDAEQRKKRRRNSQVSFEIYTDSNGSKHIHATSFACRTSECSYLEISSYAFHFYLSNLRFNMVKPIVICSISTWLHNFNLTAVYNPLLSAWILNQKTSTLTLPDLLSSSSCVQLTYHHTQSCWLLL